MFDKSLFYRIAVSLSISKKLILLILFVNIQTKFGQQAKLEALNWGIILIEAIGAQWNCYRMTVRSTGHLQLYIYSSVNLNSISRTVLIEKMTLLPLIRHKQLYSSVSCFSVFSKNAFFFGCEKYQLPLNWDKIPGKTPKTFLIRSTQHRHSLNLHLLFFGLDWVGEYGEVKVR